MFHCFHVSGLHRIVEVAGRDECLCFMGAYTGPKLLCDFMSFSHRTYSSEVWIFRTVWKTNKKWEIFTPFAKLVMCKNSNFRWIGSRLNCEPIHLKFEFFAHVWKINKKCEIFTRFANFWHLLQNLLWTSSKRCKNFALLLILHTCAKNSNFR